MVLANWQRTSLDLAGSSWMPTGWARGTGNDCTPTPKTWPSSDPQRSGLFAPSLYHPRQLALHTGGRCPAACGEGHDGAPVDGCPDHERWVSERSQPWMARAPSSGAQAFRVGGRPTLV